MDILGALSGLSGLASRVFTTAVQTIRPGTKRKANDSGAVDAVYGNTHLSKRQRPEDSMESYNTSALEKLTAPKEDMSENELRSRVAKLAVGPRSSSRLTHSYFSSFQAAAGHLQSKGSGTLTRLHSGALGARGAAPILHPTVVRTRRDSRSGLPPGIAPVTSAASSNRGQGVGVSSSGGHAPTAPGGVQGAVHGAAGAPTPAVRRSPRLGGPSHGQSPASARSDTGAVRVGRVVGSDGLPFGASTDLSHMVSLDAILAGQTPSQLSAKQQAAGPERKSSLLNLAAPGSSSSSADLGARVEQSRSMLRQATAGLESQEDRRQGLLDVIARKLPAMSQADIDREAAAAGSSVYRPRVVSASSAGLPSAFKHSTSSRVVRPIELDDSSDDDGDSGGRGTGAGASARPSKGLRDSISSAIRHEVDEDDDEIEIVDNGAGAGAGQHSGAAGQTNDEEEDEEVVELLDSDDEEEKAKEAEYERLHPRLLDCTVPDPDVDAVSSRNNYAHVRLTGDARLKDSDYKMIGRLLLPKGAAKPKRWRYDAVPGRCCSDYMTWEQSQKLLDGEWLNNEIINFELARLKTSNVIAIVRAHGIDTRTALPHLHAHQPDSPLFGIKIERASMPQKRRFRPATVPVELPAAVEPGILSRCPGMPTAMWQHNLGGDRLELAIPGRARAHKESPRLDEVAPAPVPIKATWTPEPILSGNGASKPVRALLWNVTFLQNLTCDDPWHWKYDFSKVKRYTDGNDGLDLHPIDVTHYDLILIPVHLRIHWALMALDIRGRSAHWYDSLLMDTDDNVEEYARCMQHALRWLHDELEEKKRVLLDTKSWRTYIHTPDEGCVPQKNGFDCGMFLMEYARALVTGKRFDFKTEDMRFLRRRLALTIVKSKPDGSGLPGCAAPPS